MGESSRKAEVCKSAQVGGKGVYSELGRWSRVCLRSANLLSVRVSTNRIYTTKVSENLAPRST